MKDREINKKKFLNNIGPSLDNEAPPRRKVRKSPPAKKKTPAPVPEKKIEVVGMSETKMKEYFDKYMKELFMP